MRLLGIILCMATLGLSAQSKRVTESVLVSGQTNLDLAFDFADEIIFEVWDKQEVLVEVDVEIDGGDYNDIFSLNSSKTSSSIRIEMDEDMWDEIDRRGRKKNCWTSTINYKVYLPKDFEVSAKTISGNFELKYYGKPMNLKTISGEIDITVPDELGLDFKASTISGELFTDIEMDFPYGKEGLRQIVGQNIRARISEGGEVSEFETISGNIYLRKG